MQRAFRDALRVAGASADAGARKLRIFADRSLRPAIDRLTRASLPGSSPPPG